MFHFIIDDERGNGSVSFSEFLRFTNIQDSESVE